MSRRARPRLTLWVQVATRSRGVPSRTQFGRWAGAALRGPAEITVRLVGEREGALLNCRYRGKSGATNVLSFRYGERGAVTEGDIVVCSPLVRREARARRRPLAAHYAHLVVHGVLHLQGYDHQRERDARAMEAREISILRRLGISDPYHSQERAR